MPAPNDDADSVDEGFNQVSGNVVAGESQNEADSTPDDGGADDSGAADGGGPDDGGAAPGGAAGVFRPDHAPEPGPVTFLY